MPELKTSPHSVAVNPNDANTEKFADAPARLWVRSFGLTDRGQFRPTNEAQFLIAVLLKALRVEQTSLPQPKVQHGSERAYLFVVADGMGGHAGGEKASALAVDSVEQFVLETFTWFAHCQGEARDQVLADFKDALGQANERVLAESAERPELSGMGTTLTLAYSLNDNLFVAHVGDSRCYLGRQENLYRLTRDHSLVEEMVRRGALPAEEAAQHQWRHVITNAVGGNTPAIKVEVHKIHLEDGDRVLLCSDGLTGMVSDDEVNQILQSEIEPELSCRRLVARANEAGGRDNITAVVAHFQAVKEQSNRESAAQHEAPRKLPAVHTG